MFFVPIFGMLTLNAFTDFINKVINKLKTLDWASLIGWGVLALIIITVLIIGITFLVMNIKDKQFKRRIAYESSSTVVYRINNQKDEIVYFDLGDLSKKKTTNKKDFFASFPKGEQDKVEKWVLAILAGRQTSEFLQTSVYINKNKAKTSPCYLRITKSDPVNGLLHFENCMIQSSVRKKAVADLTPIISENQFANALKNNGTARGTTFCFNIRRKKAQGYDNNVPKQVSYKFRVALDRYIHGNVSLMKLSDYEFLLCSYDISDNDEAISFALKAVNGITNAMLGKTKIGDFPYVIKAGIVANKDTFGDTESIIDCSQRSAISAYETSSSLYVYHKGADASVSIDVAKYRSEVEKIIFDKRIANLFQPVYGVARHSVLGYISEPVPDAERTSFSTIEELKNYAIRAKDQNNLFNYLAKTTVSRFVSERPLRSQRLFYPVMIRELQSIPAIYSNLRGAKDANITFLIREPEAFSAIKQTSEENFLALIRNIHDEGFEVGLIVQGQAINVDETVLKMMDIFFVDFKNENIDSKHMDMVIRSQLHALVEKLLKYSKIIVGINLPDWNAIELVVGSGIDYVSSNQFGPYQNGFVPLKEKDELRLNEMKGLRK